MALLQSDPRPATLLDVFLQRYTNLLRFAESLTRDRREAEDLVQDACVRVLLATPDISHIENVDGYLIATLRNLHMTRTRRRQARPEAHLCIVDFDSAGFALEALSHATSLHARDVLRTACRYACARRFTSKTASLFILHFFHEYVRAEIAVIAHLSRASVDTGLTRARVEVRAYLDDPDAALSAIELPAAPELRVDRAPARDDDDYVARLRGAIFALRHSRCFDTPFLQRLYADATAPISTDVLAEIVACPRCLDAVSRITRLPVLADRHPRQIDIADAMPRRSSGARREDRQICRVAAEHKARIIRAHRPRALRVLVNGFQIGSHEVTAPTTRATHALSVPEPPRLVEICSEQDVCLATLQVETVPDAAVSQHATIDLDEGRHLDIGIVFDAPWPTLQLSYVQPLDVSLLDISSAKKVNGDERAARDETPIGPRRRWPRFWSGVAEAVCGLAVWPQPLRATTAIAVVWLFFFTPGTPASAAEITYRALAQLVHVAWEWLHPAPAPLPAREWSPRMGGLSGFPTPPAVVRPETPTAAPVARPWSRLERTHTEILALALLQQIDAYLGQEIQFGAGRDGRARVDSVVGDRARRDDVHAILAPLVSDGALDVSVLTPEEVTRRRAPQPPRATDGPSDSTERLRVYEFERDRVAVADLLLAHLGTPQAVRDFANEVVDHSRRASLQAWSLQHLSERFDAALIRQLPPGDRDLLLGVVEQHVREFDHEIEVLSTALAPIFGVSSGGRAQAQDPGDFWTMVRTLLDLNRARDASIHRTLVVGTAANPGPDLGSSQFWERLRASQRLARQLRHQPRLLPD